MSYKIYEELCAKIGVKPSKLAKEAGVDPSTITNWKKGVYYPKEETRLKLAQKIGVSLTYLDSGKGVTLGDAKFRAMDIVPIIGQAAAGQPIDAIQDIQGFVQLDAKDYNNGEFYALNVKGDSMYPQINNGDLVIVKQQTTVDEGDIAVVLVNGDSATIKKVSFSSNGIKLIPFNKDYEEMAYGAQDVINLPVRIVGKVIEVRRRF